MSNIVHDKYHRQNHHSFITSDVTDMGLDPIASKELPFSGEFVMDNADHETWLLSSDRVAFEWVSGYGGADDIKFDTNLSGAFGKSITYPSGTFHNVAIDGGAADVPALSVVGKSVFTDDVIYNGDIKLDGNLTVPTINTVGISADSVLISGNDGFVLNVTNGSSKFNDVTGVNFVASENFNVSGDLTVADNLNVSGDLYFTSGIASGGFLNVAGSAIFGNLKVNGRIEADKYYFNEVVGKAIFNDYSGFVLHSTSLPDNQKTLIPGKDAGATTYNPGIGNFTLSAMGLSSDSWADFSGNVRINGNKFYDDASETIFSNLVYFKGLTSASSFSAECLSAQNGVFPNLTGYNVYLVNPSAVELSAYNLSVASATANYMCATDLSGFNFSADHALVSSLTVDNLTLVEPINSVVFADGFYLNSGKAKMQINDSWGYGLIEGENIVSDGFIVTTSATRQQTNTNPNPAVNKRVPNIGFCDREYLTLAPKLSGYPGFSSTREDAIRGSYDATRYSYVYADWLPWLDDAKQSPCNIRLDEAAIEWYNDARSKIYICGTYGGYTHRMKAMLTTYHLSQNHDNEFCYDLLFISDGNASLNNQFLFRLFDNDRENWLGDLRIGDMYNISGGKITMSNIRGNRSGTCRTRLRVHFCPDQYAIVEVLGINNSSTFGTNWFTL